MTYCSSSRHCFTVNVCVFYRFGVYFNATHFTRTWQPSCVSVYICVFPFYIVLFTFYCALRRRYYIKRQKERKEKK